MGFDDVINNIKSKVADPTTSSDVLEILNIQTQLLQKLVAYNTFEQTDTDKPQLNSFNLHVNIPANTIVIGSAIVPARKGFEIHVNTWFASIHGGVGTASLLWSLGANLNPRANWVAYGPKYLLHDLYMTFANEVQHDHVQYPIPQIFTEDDGDLQFAVDVVPGGPAQTPSLDIIVSGNYYSRKNNPAWTTPRLG